MLIDRHGSVFIKPVFKGGVGKKGKAGLLGRAKDLKTALKEKERLYCTSLDSTGQIVSDEVATRSSLRQLSTAGSLG